MSEEDQGDPPFRVFWRSGSELPNQVTFNDLVEAFTEHLINAYLPDWGNINLLPEECRGWYLQRDKALESYCHYEANFWLKQSGKVVFTLPEFMEVVFFADATFKGISDVLKDEFYADFFDYQRRLGNAAFFKKVGEFGGNRIPGEKPDKILLSYAQHYDRGIIPLG